MARPSTQHGPKKEELAQTAFDLFVKQGYDQTTVAQIMRAAGLTKAGMYHYYSSKEDILDAAIEHAIGQYIEKLREDLSGCGAEEKILRFSRGSATPSGVLQTMMRIKRSEHDSYAAYRIRERCIHAYIPVMEEIIREGVSQGVYRAEYPRQAAEFMVLLSKAIVETNLLPEAGHEGASLRVRAFLQLVEGWLHPSREHLADIAALFYEEISDIAESEETNEE